MANELNPDLATHPGDHLKEYLETRGMSLSELARVAKLSKGHLCDVIHRRCAVGVKTALKFEQVFGLGADIWLNIQANWDLHQARRDARDKKA